MPAFYPAMTVAQNDAGNLHQRAALTLCRAGWYNRPVQLQFVLPFNPQRHGYRAVCREHLLTGFLMPSDPAQTPDHTAITVATSDSWVIYRRLLSYLRPWWGMLLLSIIGFALYAASQTAFARWMEQVVDAVQSSDPDARLWVALTVIGIFLVRGIGTFLGQYGLAYISRHVIHRMRCQVFDKLLVLPARFYQQQAEGQLLASLTYTAEQVTGAITDALRVLIREGFTLLGLLAYLLYLNWQLTLVFFAVGPLIVVVVARASNHFRELGRQIQRSVGDIAQSAGQALDGHEVVRVFAGHAQEQQRFNAASDHNRRQNLKEALIRALVTPAVQLVLALALAGLIWIAMRPELLAEMTTGQFIAFLTAAGMIARPMRQLTTANALIQKGIAAAQDLFTLLDRDEEPDTGTRTLPATPGTIELSQLSFSYPNSERPALDNISLTLPTGQTTALVGGSGSGKSTLAVLLARFYEPQQGQILIGGQPLTDFSLASLRQRIALVSQQTLLFDGSIADNIARGCPQASAEQIQAAALAAHVTEFSDRLADGLDTRLGEGGIALSGGQRQRIAIARALIKDAPILILDEATSALDTASERHIQQALAELMKDRTTLIIAHRLSTIEQADNIVVMAQGRIVEQGSHQQLLVTDGAYAALQRARYTDTSVAQQNGAQS